MLARKHASSIRTDWVSGGFNLHIMEVALWAKFTQRLDLRALLLGTGERGLVEDSERDGFWGVGKNGKGRNELGRALEMVRGRLRREEEEEAV